MCGQIRDIVESDIEAATVGRAGHHVGRCDTEEIAAEFAIQIHTGLVFRIEQRGYADRHPAQRVVRLVQHLVAEPDQPPQGAADHLLGHRHGRATRLLNDQLLVVRGLRIADHTKSVEHRANHQCLTGTDEHVHGAVVLLQGRDTGVLTEFVDQAITFIEDVVGCPITRPRQVAYAVVDLGQRLRQRVDLIGLTFEILIQLVAQVFEPTVQRREAIAQLGGPVDHHGTRRDRGRIVRHIVHAGEELLQHAVDAGGRIGDDIVYLLGALFVDVELLVRGVVIPDPGREIGIVAARDIRNLHPGSDITR